MGILLCVCVSMCVARQRLPVYSFSEQDLVTVMFPPPWQSRKHVSLCGTVFFCSRWTERSQHNFQAGRNMLVEHA